MLWALLSAVIIESQISFTQTLTDKGCCKFNWISLNLNPKQNLIVVIMNFLHLQPNNFAFGTNPNLTPTWSPGSCMFRPSPGIDTGFDPHQRQIHWRLRIYLNGFAFPVKLNTEYRRNKKRLPIYMLLSVLFELILSCLLFIKRNR